MTREAEDYTHFTERLLADAGDPAGSYLAAQVQRQFRELFPPTTAKDIARIVGDHLGVAIVAPSNDTRLDDLITNNEILVIEVIGEIESRLHTDIPDYEITTTATFGQLAALVDRYKVRAA